MENEPSLLLVLLVNEVQKQQKTIGKTLKKLGMDKSSGMINGAHTCSAAYFYYQMES
jgi:hypothetical protein